MARNSTSFQSGNPDGGRPKGVPNRATRAIREIAPDLTTGNPKFMKFMKTLKTQFDNGTAHPAVVLRLLEYAHGKPPTKWEADGASQAAGPNRLQSTAL